MAKGAAFSPARQRSTPCVCADLSTTACPLRSICVPVPPLPAAHAVPSVPCRSLPPKQPISRLKPSSSFASRLPHPPTPPPTLLPHPSRTPSRSRASLFVYSSRVWHARRVLHHLDLTWMLVAMPSRLSIRSVSLLASSARPCKASIPLTSVRSQEPLHPALVPMCPCRGEPHLLYPTRSSQLFAY